MLWLPGSLRRTHPNSFRISNAQFTLSRRIMPSSALSGSYGWTDTLKTVYYGPGSLQSSLPKLLTSLNGTRALVVTGKSLYEKVSICSHSSRRI